MKKEFIVLASLLLLGVSANAYRAAATFIANQGNNIQIIIDGKVMNQEPKNRVSIIGRPGEHEVSINFFDELGNPSLGDSECIQLNSGYKSYYEIVDNNDCGDVVKVKMEPYSLKKYKDPDYYYNEKFLSRAKLKNKNKIRFGRNNMA